jgi:hypothetical protein
MAWVVVGSPHLLQLPSRFQVTPMLKAFYEKIADQRHGGASKLKSDATFFTIADGIVQHMFIE